MFLNSLIIINSKLVVFARHKLTFRLDSKFAINYEHTNHILISIFGIRSKWVLEIFNISLVIQHLLLPILLIKFNHIKKDFEWSRESSSTLTPIPPLPIVIITSNKYIHLGEISFIFCRRLAVNLLF